MTNTVSIHLSDKELETFKRKFGDKKASKWIKEIVKKELKE